MATHASRNRSTTTMGNDQIGTGTDMSHFHKTVCLQNWWLVRAGRDFERKRLAVAGFMSNQIQGLRQFNSAPIIKTYNLHSLQTADGVTVMLSGFINQSRTILNGFPPEVFNHFVIGFPPYWEDYAESLMKVFSSRVKSKGIPHTESTINSGMLDSSPISTPYKYEGCMANSFTFIIENLKVSPSGIETTKTNDTPYVSGEKKSIGCLRIAKGSPKENQNDKELASNPAKEKCSSRKRAERIFDFDASVTSLTRGSEMNGSDDTPESLGFNCSRSAVLGSSSSSIPCEYKEGHAAISSTLLKENLKVSPSSNETSKTNGSPHVSGQRKGIGCLRIAKDSPKENHTVKCSVKQIDKDLTFSPAKERCSSRKKAEGKYDFDYCVTPLMRGREINESDYSSESSGFNCSRSGMLNSTPGSIPCKYKEGRAVNSSALVKENLKVSPSGKGTSKTNDSPHVSSQRKSIGCSRIAKDSPKENHRVQCFVKQNDKELTSNPAKGRCSSRKKAERKYDFDACVTPLTWGTEKKGSDNSQESLGFKRSRSGRLLLPPLDFWRNQIAVYDSDRTITAIKEKDRCTSIRGRTGSYKKKR